MKSKKLLLFLALALVLSWGSLYAQDAPKGEESPMKIWGVTFTSFNFGMTNLDRNYTDRTLGQFFWGFDNIRLGFDHKLSKNFSYHFVISGTVPHIMNTNTISIFIRNAFVRATTGLDDMVKVTFDFGIVNIPICANRYKMIDDRWLTAESYNSNVNLIGARMKTSSGYVGANLAPGGNGDPNTDAGVNIEISIMKMISLSFLVTAGEGFTNLGTDLKATNAGKAWYGYLLIEPIKGLCVTGYVRYENTQFLNAAEPFYPAYPGIDEWIAGAGIGVNMLGIRAGVDFESGQYITKYSSAVTPSSVAQNYFVMNGWFSWNLKQIAGFPLLILTRVSYGTLNTGLKINDTFYYYAGLGWQFNKNVRVALIFESFVYSAAEFAQANNTTIDDTAFMTTRVSSYPANSMLKFVTEAKF